MILKGIYDYDMKEIDTEKTYFDLQNNVEDIQIESINGEYFAKPSGLDAEPLKDVSKNLTAKRIANTNKRVRSVYETETIGNILGFCSTTIRPVEIEENEEKQGGINNED